MSRTEAIKCQLAEIGEHIVTEGYSYVTMQEFVGAILDLHDLVAGELHMRLSADPTGGLLDGIKRDGGGA
jgi:hypothetical protein